MLFNSYKFIFFFLPVAIVGFYIFGRRGYKELAFGWLIATSLLFYGWWNPSYVFLILCSMLVNYSCGAALSQRKAPYTKWLLAGGILANLGLLGYYKYADFFLESVHGLLGTEYNSLNILLPLAISFFTFQQIAYLVDAYKGKAREYNFLHYTLFVTFFPQLIAGPIVHHKEILPQFAQKDIGTLHGEDIAVGLSLFTMGLFKKVVIADRLAVYANAIFLAAEQGAKLCLPEAWLGALAYTFQLYFDFSGYSDMALGLALLFGIRLPANFNSPYKATSIIEFWRRWHMTLSRFLRDYIYIPLGGSRRGRFRRFGNLFLTMLIGGLWHGAGWTFVVWGALHGCCLIVNHGWNHFFNSKEDRSTLQRLGLSRLMTFIAVVVGWVLFRAGSFSAAIRMLSAMFDISTLAADYDAFPIVGGEVNAAVTCVVLAWLACWYAPNTLQIMSTFSTALETFEKPRFPRYGLNLRWSLILSVLFVASMVHISRSGKFLYFDF